MAGIREILAKNMRINRQKLGITQAELAERANISSNFVTMIELQHKFPTPEVLERIASALGVEIHELFTSQASEKKLENSYQAVVSNLEHIICYAIDKAIDKKLTEIKS